MSETRKFTTAGVAVATGAASATTAANRIVKIMSRATTDAPEPPCVRATCSRTRATVYETSTAMAIAEIAAEARLQNVTGHRSGVHNP